MKKKKKKRTSSYLLIFLSIIVFLLLVMILYLSFQKKQRQTTTAAVTETNSALAANEDADGFISDEYFSDSGFTSADGISDPDSQEIAGPMQSSETPEEVTVPYQTPAVSDEAPAVPQPTTAPEATPPQLSSDDGTISPSHGSSAFDNKADENMEALVSQIKSSLPSGNGSWSVYICDLSGDAQATINDTPMQAASLIKLFIMGAVYENYDSLSQQYGSAAIDSYLAPMITVSDNDAANSLVSFLGSGDSTLGMQKVNSFCQSHGYTGTSMGRLLLASNEFGDNYTSASDCGKFLKEIYQICAGTTQTPSLHHAEDMYALLKQQQRTNKIPAALPEGVRVANKTGELSDVENDAGILYNTPGGKDLVICFLSQNLASTAEAQNTIAQLSRNIYLYYND